MLDSIIPTIGPGGLRDDESNDEGLCSNSESEMRNLARGTPLSSFDFSEFISSLLFQFKKGSQN